MRVPQSQSEQQQHNNNVEEEGHARQEYNIVVHQSTRMYVLYPVLDGWHTTLRLRTSQSDSPRQLWTIFIIVFVIIHFTLIDIINNKIGYPFGQTLRQWCWKVCR